MMCEWHQLVYFSITANKPTPPPDFRYISTFVLAPKPKMQNFWPKNNAKNYTYLSPIFNPNICSKLKSTFTANLKVRPCYLTGTFPVNVFRGLYISHLSDPVFPILSCLVHARKFSHSASVEPPSTTSKISNPLNFLLLQSPQIALVGPGIHPQNGQRDSFTRGPQSLLHSMSGDSVGVKPPLTSVFFQRLSSSLMMPDWGLLQRKMARKNTCNAINLLDSRSCTTNVMYVT